MGTCIGSCVCKGYINTPDTPPSPALGKVVRPQAGLWSRGEVGGGADSVENAVVFIFFPLGEVFLYDFVEDLVHARSWDSLSSSVPKLQRFCLFMAPHISYMFLSCVLKKNIFFAYLM